MVAAGASGLALLAAPGSTDRYFSWTLGPPGAAALIGGFYLASAVAFGIALTLPWRQVRPLLVAVLGLAVPTLVLTIIHDEVFDFGRWQARAWVALFVAAPVSTIAILLVGRVRPDGREAAGRPLRPWSRGLLAALALVLAVLAPLIWFDATRDVVARHSPVGLVRLTGTYLGAWCSFLAVACGWAAWGGRWDDARTVLVTLAAASGGAAIAFVRSFGEIRRPVVALTVAVTVALAAALVYAANRPVSAHR